MKRVIGIGERWLWDEKNVPIPVFGVLKGVQYSLCLSRTIFIHQDLRAWCCNEYGLDKIDRSRCLHPFRHPVGQVSDKDRARNEV